MMGWQASRLMLVDDDHDYDDVSIILHPRCTLTTYQACVQCKRGKLEQRRA